MKRRAPLSSWMLRALAATAFLWFVAGQARAVNPLFYTSYEGERDRLLARSEFGDIRESEFFLYLVMRDDTMPNIVERYLTEPSYRRREELRDRLHMALEDFLLVKGADRFELRERYPRSIDPVAREFYLYPVYEWVWSLAVVETDLGLARHNAHLIPSSLGDLRKFYKDHPELFTRRGTVQSRYIFRRLTDPDDPRALAEAEAFLRRVREHAVAGEDFGQLARQYSDAPNAELGGLTPPVVEGEMFVEYDDAVSELGEGEISQPFRGVGGVYLVKVEKITPKRLPPFAEILEEVRQKLVANALRWKEVFTLDEIKFTWRTGRRLPAWKSRDTTDWLVKVNDFKLSSADFLRMFPEVVEPTCLTDEVFLDRRTASVFVGELFKSQLEERNRLGDPRIQRAWTLAPAMLRSRRLLRERERRLDQPTTETVRQFYKDNPGLFETVPKYRLTRIEATLRRPERHGVLKRLALIDDVKEQMKQLVFEQTIILKELDRNAPEFLLRNADNGATGTATADEDDISTQLAQLKLASYYETFRMVDPEVYEVRIERVNDYFTKDNTPEYLPPEELAGLRKYKALGPMNVDDRAVFWICEGVEEDSTPPFEDIAWIVRSVYRRYHKGSARRQLVDEALARAKVTWLYGDIEYEPAEPLVQPTLPRPDLWFLEALEEGEEEDE